MMGDGRAHTNTPEYPEETSSPWHIAGACEPCQVRTMPHRFD